MIYFDNAATTKVSQSAAEEAVRVMTEVYGNPSSLHRLGIDAEKEIIGAEEYLKSVLGDKSGTVVFTSGGTEANNIAIRGAMYLRRRRMDEMVIDYGEHESSVYVAEELKKDGFTVHFINPLPDGKGDIEKIADATGDRTGLVSLMAVNNETGSITDIKRAVSLIKKKNRDTLVHVDCVAALGKEDINVRDMGADIYTFSGHKIHAPKGIGALYIKKGVRLAPTVFPGGQGHGIRPGTEATPLIASFKKALEDTEECRAEAYGRIREINRYIRENLPEGTVVNSPEDASPYILNISGNKVKSEILIHYLENHEIYISGGSACSKGAKSHVLTGMGLPPCRVETALRLSFSENNTQEEAKEFLEKYKAGLDSLIGSFQKGTL